MRTGVRGCGKAGKLLSTTVSIVFLLTVVFAVVPQDEAGACSRPRPVKNIILMVGDGMGYNHVLATDYYKAGRACTQDYERFPVRLGMSTYQYEPVDGEYVLLGYDTRRAWGEFNYVKGYATDSAAAATAMSTGTKTRDGAIGVNIGGRPLRHLVEIAEDRGMATGVITSVQWSHATPAGFIAHNGSRNNYEAIAREMIESSETDVIMGCGHPGYDDNGKPTDAKVYKYVGGGIPGRDCAPVRLEARWTPITTGSWTTPGRSSRRGASSRRWVAGGTLRNGCAERPPCVTRYIRGVEGTDGRRHFRSLSMKTSPRWRR